jgi:hypothetical protein
LRPAAEAGYFKLFADHAWRLADSTSHTITAHDAQDALRNAAAEVEERTLGPRLERLTDRQAELLVAIAVHGGAARTAELTVTLARPSSTAYSRTRDELITEGDIYAPRRGELALTVPLFAQYLLANYEHVRGRAAVPLLSLGEMQRNVEAGASGRLGPRGQALPASRAVDRPAGGQLLPFAAPSAPRPGRQPPSRQPGRTP